MRCFGFADNSIFQWVEKHFDLDLDTVLEIRSKQPQCKLNVLAVSLTIDKTFQPNLKSQRIATVIGHILKKPGKFAQSFVTIHWTDLKMWCDRATKQRKKHTKFTKVNRDRYPLEITEIFDYYPGMDSYELRYSDLLHSRSTTWHCSPQSHVTSTAKVVQLM